jgi:hypothetical protein
MSMALEGGDTPQLPLALAVAVTTAVSSPSPVLLVLLRGPNPAQTCLHEQADPILGKPWGGATCPRAAVIESGGVRHPKGRSPTVKVRHQLLMMLLESADDSYPWLNNTVCICEGAFDPRADSAHINVVVCTKRALGHAQIPEQWLFSAGMSLRDQGADLSALTRPVISSRTSTSPSRSRWSHWRPGNRSS